MGWKLTREWKKNINQHRENCIFRIFLKSVELKLGFVLLKESTGLNNLYIVCSEGLYSSIHSRIVTIL